MTGQISKADPPWIQEFYVTWMIRGISNNEAITWMKAVEKGVPPVVFQTLVQKAKQELPAGRFQEISKSLAAEIPVASSLNLAS